MLVGDRERVAVDPIPGPELAFEIRGPEVVGRRRDRRHDAGVLLRAAPPPFLHEPVPGEQIAGGADRRPRDGRMSGLEPLQQFLRPPVGVLPPCRQQELRDGLGNLVRADMRGTTPVAERGPAAGIVARHPFVAGLSADGVAGAELGHVVESEAGIINESFSLFHGCCLQPGHRSTSQSIPSVVGVTHVPGQMCYLCTRFVYAQFV